MADTKRKLDQITGGYFGEREVSDALSIENLVTQLALRINTLEATVEALTRRLLEIERLYNRPTGEKTQ